MSDGPLPTVDEEEDGRGVLLIAAREPTPGTTKTRLGAAIGMERAAELYAAFLVDLSARFTPCPGEDWGFDVGWAFTPAEVDFACVLQQIGCAPPPVSVRFVPQHGDGWDMRQANILAWGHAQGYERTVLIGSDSPQLPVAVVREAFAALTDHDVVMGRTVDGGYYLIGVRGFQDILTGVPMSTATVADALADRSKRRGLRLAELPETFDIDEEQDLEHLRLALDPDGAAAPATWVALRRLGLNGR
ncbi:MAG: TIGR04282 family arsenosugar biosynthesis glycosyltransferase [Chloroflexi bacterium]|nr:TIGR04282 family arsenosugar biosynthesis glycosyltransferase [Chloroflexota bacterium]